MNSDRRGKSWKREREERGRLKVTGNSGEADRKEGSGDGSEKQPADGNCAENVATPVDLGTAGGAEITTSQQDVPSNIPESSSSSNKAEEDNKKEEEKIMAMNYARDLAERLENKVKSRTTNHQAAGNRPEDSFFSKLDSSLKKNTAFVKRLKNLTEAQSESLFKDMQGLNLTKYIGEVAAAIVDAKLKMSDISAATTICSLLHQRYSEFSTALLDNWQKQLSLKKDEKIANPSKLRVDLRFYAELISVGVFGQKESLPLLGNLLTMLIHLDKEEHNNINILLSFCRHCGEDYAGLVPRKMRILAQNYGVVLPQSKLLTPERQKSVRGLLKDYYNTLCRHLTSEHKEIQHFDRQNRRILQTRGELSSERKDKYEVMVAAYQKLVGNTQVFAEILDEDMPELPDDDFIKQDECGVFDVHNRFKNSEMQFDGDLSVWEDEDTKSFYENLHDLKSCIPGILFKDSAQATAPVDTSNKVIEDDVTLEVEDELKEAEEFELEKKEGDTPEEILPPEIEADLEDEPEPLGSGSLSKKILDTYLANLPTAINREMIDKMAVEFCMNLNTKPNRRKLIKFLFMVPRTRLDLLPFYARLVATLNPCMPDIATELATLLKQDFRYHVRKKDQINIESKIKNVRFIGELVKFKMFQKSEALNCLKMLLLDFSHHHIEMTCNLLETCGRYLYRMPESHQRTKVYLDQMMRKKAVMAMDSRYITTIENAFYYCNPPEATQFTKKERPPLNEYIRQLLYKELSRNTTEKVLRQMRRLSWDDPDVAAYCTKCLISIWNVKYYNIRCVANLLAGLVSHQDFVGPHVVDGVLEGIRLGMEVNHPKFNQRRVATVKYLGELYNYRLVESAVIFKVLYSFITFGGELDDPPDHLFRIRLACILLDTCGQYFNSGSSKKKLDYFLMYFQYYYWQKKSNEVWGDSNPFPVTMEFMYRDTLTMLRPKLKQYESLDGVQQAVHVMEKEILSKLVEVMPSLKQRLHEDEEGTDFSDGLEAIQEGEEGGDEDEPSTAASDTEIYPENDDDPGLTGESQSQPMEMDHDEDERTSLTGADHTPYERESPSGGPDSTDPEGGGGDADTCVLPNGPRHLKCAEDDDFMTAFDKILSESIQHRTQDVVKTPQSDITVPLHVKSTLKKSNVAQSYELGKVEEKNTINFLLMTRRGNKTQFKNLEVPVNSELAQNLRDKEEVERAEKERVKRLTLNINERQEEEDYQEMMATQQRPVVMNLNRDRRHKYQHPKGAPDADVIFGNKL